ncbi:MAG: hypothetical protein C0605_16345 [Hyphomicrobiales bacterium]|nr:MAG: hypothetical protein C0605_16345 [Hyphomicrobiales bacterium]
MSFHRYAIGQPVRLISRFGLSLKTAEIFRITGTLPKQGDTLQYRIRNEEERHERVATEHCLELVEEK